jgi:hypothetical protein
VANNQSKALQMLLKAEELEAALVRESRATSDRLQVFQEVPIRLHAVGVPAGYGWCER